MRRDLRRLRMDAQARAWAEVVQQVASCSDSVQRCMRHSQPARQPHWKTPVQGAAAASKQRGGGSDGHQYL